MNNSIFSLRPWLSLVICWSNIFAPLLVHSPIAQAQDIVIGGPPPLTGPLALKVDPLVDCVMYPGVDRTPQEAAVCLSFLNYPSTRKLEEITTDIQLTRRSLHTALPEKLYNVTDPYAEAEILHEIQTYFKSVQLFEGLRLLLGEPLDHTTWQNLYSLEIPLSRVSQQEFVRVVALAGVYYTFNADELILDESTEMSATALPYQAQLIERNNDWIIQFNLNPFFVMEFERLNLLKRSNMWNMLMFAGHFISHRLYDSLELTQNIQGKSDAQLPEAWGELADRWYSLKMRRDDKINARVRELHAHKNPEILNSVMAAMDTIDSLGTGHLASKMIEVVLRLGNIEDDTALLNPEEMQTTDEESLIRNINEDHRSAVRKIINAFLQMTGHQRRQDLPYFLIYNATRLSLRWMSLANPDILAVLSPEAEQELTTYIDQQSYEYATRVIGQTQVVNQVLAVIDRDQSVYHAEKRQEFQEKIENGAKQIEKFKEEQINFQYLLGAQSNHFNSGMRLGPINRALLEALADQMTFESAFNTYKQFLMNWVSGFHFVDVRGRSVSVTTTVAGINAVKQHARWNPESLNMNGAVAPPFMRALSADPAARKQDLADMLEIGMRLRMDVYERLPDIPKPDGQPGEMTKDLRVSNFNLNSFCLFCTSEMGRYLNELKNDVINNSPVLGGMYIEELHIPLWEMLNVSHFSAATKKTMTDEQLAKVERQINDNAASTIRQLRRLDTTPENAISGVGGELKTLVTRTSQLSVGLESFASFKSYSAEIRKQLLFPSFLQRQFDAFASWSMYASLGILAYIFMATFGSKGAVIGPIVEWLGSALAPVFGHGLSKINKFWNGFMAVYIGQSAGNTIAEGSRLSVITRYFECGAGLPCVSLYEDVTAQADIVKSGVMQTMMIAAFWAMAGIGIRGAQAVGKKLLPILKTRSLQSLPKDMETLGLRAGDSILPNDLKIAMDSALRRVDDDVALNAIQDQVERETTKEARRLAIKMAHDRINQTVNKDALDWLHWDDRFEATSTKLGYNKSYWRNVDPSGRLGLDDMLSKLNRDKASGAITRVEYDELYTQLTTMSQVFRPVFEAIVATEGGGHLLLKNFFTRVWNTANNMGRYEIQAGVMFGERRILEGFLSNMDRVYGAALRRPSFIGRVLRLKNADPSQARVAELDNMLQQLRLELSSNTQLNPERLRALQRLFDGRGLQ